jgi:zinc/manganese transport system substrate-binding protein
MRIAFLVLACLFCLPASGAKLKVVTSFSILEDWAAKIGGKHITVVSLVGRDSDTHSFRPTPADVGKVANAQLLIVNGLGFEGWIVRLLEIADFKGTTLVASNGINRRVAVDSSEIQSPGAVNPHAWHSLRKALIYVRNIERALSEIDPKNSSSYSANADKYVLALEELDLSYVAAFSAIPVADKKIVTSHDSFSYLASDYGLELLSPSLAAIGVGISARKMALLIEQIRAHNIKALFLENAIDPRVIEQISRETQVAIGGKLFSDSLSALDGPAPSYIVMMQHNIETILAALKD